MQGRDRGWGDALSYLRCKENLCTINTSPNAKTLYGQYPCYLWLEKIPPMALIPK